MTCTQSSRPMVQHLTDAALDYCVAQASRVDVTLGSYYGDVVVYHAPFEGREYSPSTSWAQGGPLLHQHGIGVAEIAKNRWHAHCQAVPGACFVGKTPLEAAMRCLVAKRFGLEAPTMPEQLHRYARP